MDQLKDKGKRVIENIGERKFDMLQKWEEKSRDFIDAFLLLFGREGRLVKTIENGLRPNTKLRLILIVYNFVFQSHFWNEGKDRLMSALSPPGSPLPDRERSSDRESSTRYERTGLSMKFS